MRHLFRFGALSFFTGIALAFPAQGMPFAALFGVLALLCIRGRLQLALLIGGIALPFGFFLAGFQIARYEDAAAQFPQERTTFTGTVVRDIEQRRAHQLAVVGDLRAEGTEMRGRILLRFPLSVDARVFDQVTFICRPELPEPILEDGRTFYYNLFLAGQGIHAVCSFPRKVAVEGRRGNIRGVLFTIKHALTEKLGQVYPEPEASLLTGLLLGRASAEETSIKESFAATGLSHIVAVSGWNVTMVILLVESLLLTFLMRKHALPVVLGMVLVYVLLVGAEGSVVRAGIMGSIVVLGRTFGRKADMVNVLIVASLAMVLMRPFWLLFDIGFQLSVVATLGLMTFSGPLAKRLAFIPGVFGIRETASASIVANLFTLPLTLYTFGTLPGFALPANLLTVPLLPFASLFGFAATLVSFAVEPLGRMLALVPEGMLAFVIRIAEGFAALPFTIALPGFSAWTVAIVFALLAAALRIIPLRR